MDMFREKRRKSSEWDMQASLEAEPPNSRASLLEAEAKRRKEQSPPGSEERLENAHGMSNKRLKDFTLDVYDGSLFQSLTSIMTTSRLSSMPINKLIASIASNIETQLTDPSYTDELSDIVNNHIFNCVHQMIDYEKYAWNQDYFVFYHILSKKYIVYAFNTLMLELFSSGCPHNEIICAASLNRQHAPTMQGIMKRFAEDPNFNDSMESNEPPYLLLSVNNSLVPKGKDSQFHRHFNYVSEGRPLNFFSGYGGSDYWMTDLILFLQNFFEIENYAEAKDILDELQRLYYAQLDPLSPVNGHLIQIFVPSDKLHDFVYLSRDYGRPVTVYRSKWAQSHLGAYSSHQCYPKFMAPPTEDLEPVDIGTVLRSQWGASLQSRILAHPDLFLKHGAHTKIYHGDPTFDPLRFRREMMDIMHPYILKAQSKGKRLWWTYIQLKERKL